MVRRDRIVVMVSIFTDLIYWHDWANVAGGTTIPENEQNRVQHMVSKPALVWRRVQQEEQSSRKDSQTEVQVIEILTSVPAFFQREGGLRFHQTQAPRRARSSYRTERRPADHCRSAGLLIVSNKLR